jgi:hypothetical protein
MVYCNFIHYHANSDVFCSCFEPLPSCSQGYFLVQAFIPISSKYTQAQALSLEPPSLRGYLSIHDVPSSGSPSVNSAVAREANPQLMLLSLSDRKSSLPGTIARSIRLSVSDQRSPGIHAPSLKYHLMLELMKEFGQGPRIAAQSDTRYGVDGRLWEGTGGR